MVKAGLSQEMVIAKIDASACDFDTSPTALKVLKNASIPEAVILAMVQAPIGMPMQGRTSVGLDLPRVQETTDAEVPAPARVDCAASSAAPVPVFCAPRTQQALTDSAEVFKVKCGDRITVLGDDKQSWLKMRTADGQVGYISSAMVSIRPQRAASLLLSIRPDGHEMTLTF